MPGDLQRAVHLDPAAALRGFALCVPEQAPHPTAILRLAVARSCLRAAQGVRIVFTAACPDHDDGAAAEALDASGVDSLVVKLL